MRVRKAFFVILLILLVAPLINAETTTLTSLRDYFNQGISQWTINKGSPTLKDQGVYLPKGVMHADSEQAYGTWEFIIFTDYEGSDWQKNHVAFIANTIEGKDWYDGYALGYSKRGLSIFRIDGKEKTKTSLFTKLMFEDQTEKQIKILRSEDGTFKIYSNNKLVKEVKDNVHKTSQYFIFNPEADGVGYISAVNVYHTVRGGCNDGIMNPWEEGIDCGGSCEPCPEDGFKICFSNGSTCEHEHKLSLKEIQTQIFNDEYYEFYYNTTNEGELYLSINQQEFLWVNDEEYRPRGGTLKLLKEGDNYNAVFQSTQEGKSCPSQIGSFDISVKKIGSVKHNGETYLLCDYTSLTTQNGIDIITEDGEPIKNKTQAEKIINSYSWQQTLNNISIE